MSRKRLTLDELKTLVDIWDGNHPTREIASTLGISPNAVVTKVKRLRKQGVYLKVGNGRVHKSLANDIAQYSQRYKDSEGDHGQAR